MSLSAQSKFSTGARRVLGRWSPTLLGLLAFALTAALLASPLDSLLVGLMGACLFSLAVVSVFLKIFDSAGAGGRPHS